MSIITLSEADCKDCYRCVRDCSVKAIKINEGQAEVVKEKCINCGQCIEICPQNAKGINNRLSKLKELLKGEKVVASIAPSFIAAFDYDPGQLVTALKELGFSAVEETALGAQFIAKEYNQLLKNRKQTLISACCPAVISLIEKHYPDLISYLSPTVSPMVAHGELIKARYKDAKVVFIGPCIAKISEIGWKSSKDAIDLAITFEQLDHLLTVEGLECHSLSNTEFDNNLTSWSRAFPVQDGVLKASDLNLGLNPDILSVSGLAECMKTFEDLLKGEIKPKFIEAMICSGGCINGPGLSSDLGINARKERVVRYAEKSISTSEVVMEDNLELDLQRQYTNCKVEEKIPTENQIRFILSQTGKFNKEDELDCGGCGYDSCQEKALAIYQGLAEVKMCIPYMKGKSESLADIIVESSPNAIIVVDKDMIIQKFNSKANQLFNCQEDISIGKELCQYVDHQDFLDAWNEQKSIFQKKVEYEQYNLIVEESIFPLAEYELVVGIITDVTEREKNKEEIAKMKETTLEKASAVINKQMQVAQEIAGLLGESTSETKAILYEVRELMQEEEL